MSKNTGLDGLVHSWTPQSDEDAERMAGQCIGRAKVLARICAEYAWNQEEAKQVFDDVHLALSVIDELLELAYRSLDEWPNRHQLMRQGWQPPTGEEGDHNERS